MSVRAISGDVIGGRRREVARPLVADVAADGARESARLMVQAAGQALAVACDVTSSEQIEAALAAASERFGGLDIAFNNAGIQQPIKPVHEITEDEWDRPVAVKLRGTFVAMKHEIELMLRRGGCAIVNTAQSSKWPRNGREHPYGRTDTEGRGRCDRALPISIRLLVRWRSLRRLVPGLYSARFGVGPRPG